MRPRNDIHRRVAALATRQYGVATRGQLVALGVSERAIGRWLASGRLIAVHVGVYGVGHRSLSQSAQWLAATLACGPTAVLSHGSAAALWQLTAVQPPRIHVTVRSHAGRVGPRSIRLHRSITLADDDVTTHESIPTTTVARTLLDLAAGMPPGRVNRVIAQADVLGLLDLADVDRLLTAHPRRPGAPVLRGLVDEHRPVDALSRSDFEDRLAELCRHGGLPAPEINVKLVGLEVDVSWPLLGVVAEADSFSFHRTRAAFERDRERDAILTAAGYVVHRFTDRQVRRAPESVIAALRRSLSDRGR